ACLRAIDVEILQQLLAVNEGIESVKWILEDRGNLTSSLTSSQYSLAGSRETSRRGSWDQDKLDSVSIGSFLDTLADDLDEYSLSVSESAVSSTQRAAPPEGSHDLPHGSPLTDKIRLEYDAHWRWVQSQDDVTFL
ncbi:leucine rich adaptor protein 1, partial [Mantella aurantiaca]